MNFNFQLLDETRIEKGVTIENVCKSAEINPSTWHRMINGDIKKPKLETIARICKYLDINMNDLID